eukprot:COSAG01_NODE_51778_length_352_cov_0.608696_2_plen_28_part_01
MVPRHHCCRQLLLLLPLLLGAGQQPAAS